MDNTFPSILSSANSVLILLPDKLTLDYVASALSLSLSLRGVKDVTVSSSFPITVEFNRLIGVNKITQELGNKNLTIKFKGYLAENIERVSADVEGSEFKLTVIPKSGLTSPKKEQVELSSSGISADLVILIGGESEDSFPVLSQSKDLDNSKIVHLGVRPLTVSPDSKIMSFTIPASSVSELATILIKEANLTLDGDSATNLIAGIEEGSKNFTSQEVTADTFEIFAHLLRSGGERNQKKVSAKDFPVGSIPGQSIVKNKQVVTPGEKNIVEEPQEEQTINPAPKDWFEPKIYKGTSIN